MARLSQKELLNEGIASALGNLVKGTAKLGAQTAAGAVKGATTLATDVVAPELTDNVRKLGIGKVAGAFKSGFGGAGKAFDAAAKGLTFKSTKLDEFITDQGYIALSSPKGPAKSKAIKVAELDYDEKAKPIKGEVYGTPLIVKYEDGAWVSVKSPRKPGEDQTTPPSDKAKSDAVSKNTAVLGDEPVEDVSAPAAAEGGADARSGEFGELVTKERPEAAAAPAGAADSAADAPTKQQESIMTKLAGLVKSAGSGIPGAAQGIADIVKSGGQIFGTGADVVKKTWDTGVPIAKDLGKAGVAGADKLVSVAQNILDAYNEYKAGYKEGLGEEPAEAAAPAEAPQQPAAAPTPEPAVPTPEPAVPAPGQREVSPPGQREVVSSEKEKMQDRARDIAKKAKPKKKKKKPMRHPQVSGSERGAAETPPLVDNFSQKNVLRQLQLLSR